MLRQILALLDAPGRRRLALGTGLSILAALLEVAALLSVKVFLTGVAQPDALLPLARPADWTLAQLAGLCIGLVSVSNLAAALSLHYNLRQVWSIEAAWSTRLLRHYLDMPYPLWVQQRLAEVGKSLLSTVLAERVLLPLTMAISKLAVSLAVVLTLLAIDPGLALVVAAAFGAVYWFISRLHYRYASRYNLMSKEATVARMETAQQILAGVRSIRLLGVEESFVARYREASRLAFRSRSAHEILVKVPRFLLETLAVLGLVGLALSFRENPAAALPIIGLYAMATYRLLPALHFTFSYLHQARFHRHVLDDFSQILQTPTTPAESSGLTFASDLACDAVSFAYPGGPELLHSVSVGLPKGQWLGLSGETGAGKSTLIDLLVGLFRPTSGSIRVDGRELSGREGAWQRLIGYVPQDLLLLDDSLEVNIAFGIPAEEIDREALERAARVAQIHDWITTELPEGYATRVGERGVLLSGGQRQRLGVARALYHDPEVVILDEATNALDESTELALLQAMRNLIPAKTVILVSHRPSLNCLCEVILRLAEGRVQAATEA